MTYQGPIQDNAHGVLFHPLSKAAVKRLVQQDPSQVTLYSTSAFHPAYRLTVAEFKERVLANTAPARILFVVPSPQDRRSFGTISVKPDGTVTVS